jgi:hypothetical protein
MSPQVELPPASPIHNPGWTLPPAAAAPVFRPSSPLPPRPASIVPQFVTNQAHLYRRNPWQLGGLVELGLALPWLWWSWLSIQFLRLFSDTAYWVVLVAWLCRPRR